MAAHPVSDNGDLLLGDETPPVEFAVGGYRPGPPPAIPYAPQIVQILPPDPTKMQAARLKQYTQQKIREATQQLAMNNIDAVQTWLHRVSEDSPARAVELYIELMKFSLPQLKETAVTMNTNQGKTYTFTSSADIAAQLKDLE